jgi:hypothetical protein
VSRSWALALVLVLACRSDPDPAPTPTPPPPAAAPAIDRAALVEGKLPEGAAETDLINAQCRICHGAEYLTQQRLTEAQWKKTIDKMRMFGATLSDEQAASLATFAGRYWNPELPDRTMIAGPPPPGALPLRRPGEAQR